MKFNTNLRKNSIKLIIVVTLKTSPQKNAISANNVAVVLYFFLALILAIVINKKIKTKFINPQINNSFHSSATFIKNSMLISPFHRSNLVFYLL